MARYIAGMGGRDDRVESSDARRSGVQVISRAATILHMLAAAPAGLTLGEVVARSGLAKSTAYRILSTLEHEQLVESFDNRYRIGHVLGRQTTPEIEKVRSRVRPLLERLATELRETVDISVLVGDQIMIVEQAFWMRQLAAGHGSGSMLPAAKTASGMALLACSPNYAESGLTAAELEARAVEAGESVDAMLARVRRDKIAVDLGRLPGVAAMATFAVDDHGNAFAMGVPVPAIRFGDKEPRIRKTLLGARPEFERIVKGN
jgi:DNA-binding IclR family transcriptional regulator